MPIPNLKELEIFGYVYILHAQLDSVPFSLTHLFMLGENIDDTDDPPPLVSILQAHLNLKELALDCSEFPSDLVAVLKAEEEDLVSGSKILCPHLKRFDGYDEGLRLFFPMRIESGTTMGSGAELIDDEDLVDIWLTPVLTSSYRHLRILEVWTDRHKNTCFLSTIAPYLTSFTHLLILDYFADIHGADHLLLSLGQISALESVTLKNLNETWVTVSDARDMVELNLPLELTEAILDHLDVADFRKTLRTASFLRRPSEKRLYHRVALPTDRFSAKGLAGIHTHFLETIVQNDHLSQHIIKLVLGDVNPPEGGNPNINCLLGQAMTNMINLKELDIYGNPYITHAHLDSVPFSLTHLVISTQIYADEEPVPGLLPILQAHPDLEELALDCSGLSDDLVAVLKAEHKGLVPKDGIICPKLKRFDGYDEGLLIFLPMRKIESGTSLGPGAGYLDDEGRAGDARWLNPVLLPSLQHLRVLEIWPKHEWNHFTCSLLTTAPYLTSLTHLEIVDDIRTLCRGNDDLLPALGRIKSLESITLASGGIQGLTMMDVRDVVRKVCNVLPDIPEIFVGIEETDRTYYRYIKGEGIQTDVVDQNVACWPYTRWLRET